MNVAMSASGADEVMTQAANVPDYKALRAEMLATEALSIPPEFADRPYRIAIEASALGGRWILVAFATGESRLLLGDGPDIVPRSNDADAADKARIFVEAAGSCLSLATPAPVPAKPEMGATAFHFLTGQGLLTAVEKSSVLRDGGSPLSPLLESGEALIERLLEKGIDRGKKPDSKRAGMPTTIALIVLAIALINAATFIPSPGLRWLGIAIGVSLLLASLLMPIILAGGSPDRDD